MKLDRTLAVSLATFGFALTTGAALGHPPSSEGTAAPHVGSHAQSYSRQGPSTQQPMARMEPDAAARADLDLVRALVHGHGSITRTVEDLSDGIRTLTESTDPEVAAALMAHVGSMMQRLEAGHVFNLFSDTIPVLFAARERIATRFEATPRGVVVIQTSSDPAVVRALQTHAREVSELVAEGPVAMRRNMQRTMMGGAAVPVQARMEGEVPMQMPMGLGMRMRGRMQHSLQGGHTHGH